MADDAHEDNSGKPTSSLGEALKLLFYPSSVLSALALAGWALLLSPPTFARRIFLEGVRSRWGPEIAIATLIFSCLLLVRSCIGGWRYFSRGRRCREILDTIFHANEGERFILQYLVLRQCSTVYLPMTDAAGVSLRHKRLLVIPGGSMSIFAVPHTMPFHLWRLLNRDVAIYLPETVNPSDELLAEVEQFHGRMLRNVRMGTP